MKLSAQEIQYAINWLEEGFNNRFQSIRGENLKHEQLLYGPTRNRFGDGFLGFRVAERAYSTFYEKPFRHLNKQDMRKALRILKILQKESQ